MTGSVGTTLIVMMCCVARLSSAEPQETTVCALTSDPAAHSGKTVSVRANVVTDYHGTFLADNGCKKMILLVLPEGSTMSPNVELKTDDAYRRFDAALHDYKRGTAQPRKRIQAQFTGRFEYLGRPGTGDRPKQTAPAPLGAQWQFVLQSVARVRLR